MNKYYIRTLPTDWPTLLKLGENLGAIALHYETNKEGEQVGEPAVSATNGGAWDYIGEIQEPTGELDEEGNQLTATVTDANGVAYWHANLITPLALGELAASMQGTDAEVAEGLANLAKFFLLDAQGNARAPSKPARVFAGMGV